MSYNKVIMMGRLTRDPEFRTLQNGTSVADLGLAVDSGWGDNKKTCFVDVTVWAKQAEFVDQWFKKGDGIHIEGRLELETWEDKNGGGKRSKHKIVSERVTFPVGSKKGSPDISEATIDKVAKDFGGKQEIDEIPF